MAWANRRGIHVEFIQPNKPQQNAYIERYNRTVRYDWLAHYLFDPFQLNASQNLVFKIMKTSIWNQVDAFPVPTGEVASTWPFGESRS